MPASAGGRCAWVVVGGRGNRTDAVAGARLDFEVAIRGLLPELKAYATTLLGGDTVRADDVLQELPWSLTGRGLDEPVTLRYDVSTLMRAAGDLYLVIKWLGGNDALNIRELRLLHDGKVQQIVAGEVISGDVQHTHANALRLPFQADAPRRGIWTLELDTVCLRTETDPPDRKSGSEGIIQICRQPAFVPSRADFVGSWMGSNEGSAWVRTFNADGTATLMHGGMDHWGDAGARWHLENGEMVVSFALKPFEVPERHMLINRNTLVFLNRPYRNAHRE